MEQRLALDIQLVETTNAQINELNGRALPVLKLITGQDLGVDSESWRAWWTERSSPKSTPGRRAGPAAEARRGAEPTAATHRATAATSGTWGFAWALGIAARAAAAQRRD